MLITVTAKRDESNSKKSSLLKKRELTEMLILRLTLRSKIVTMMW